MRISRALSEYIILPGYISKEISTDKIDLSAPLVKYKPAEEQSSFKLNLPFLSAAMQAVTGSRMAIALAQLGGLGVIYCSQPIEKEAEMVKEVKKFKAGFVVPDTFSPEDFIGEVIRRIDEKGYSTFPITHDGKPNGRLVGLLTKKDFYREQHKLMKVKHRMVPLEKLVYAKEIEDLDKANNILIEERVGILPIVDKGMHLKYAVFRKDIDQNLENVLELKDKKKRYKVGAAINTHDCRERVPELVKAEADILFIDSSQGYSDYQKETLEYIIKNFPHVPVIAGNIVTKEGFKFLVENGAYGVKIGMGPGSICITQEQIGIGRGQGSAIEEVAQARDDYFMETGIYVPIIADGGVVIAKDITSALALGADSVMMGRYLVGCEESNSEVETKGGLRFKPYWGEGSKKAKEWRAERYEQTAFEEGVEGPVPYTGSLKPYLGEATEKIREGTRKAGCKNINELHELPKKGRLELVSELSIKEGKVHSIILEEYKTG